MDILIIHIFAVCTSYYQLFNYWSIIFYYVTSKTENNKILLYNLELWSSINIYIILVIVVPILLLFIYLLTIYYIY